MANEVTYDLVVIGGGPAGYAGAIRAGQLGKKVACIEVERPGGTCLNWGCIPSKALLKSAELYRSFGKAEEFGIKAEGVTFDFAKIMGRSRDVADKMAKGVEFLFKKNKVDHIIGRGQIDSASQVSVVEGKDKGKVLKTKRILLATGCVPRPLPGIETDGKVVMTSREALAMREKPESTIIIGAGAIGVEFAYFLSSFGTEVHLVEMQDRLVPVEDPEISQALERSFKKSGIKTYTGTKVENVKVKGKTVTADFVKGDKKETVKAASLLVAIGVLANTKGLLGKGIEFETYKGSIVVTDSYETSIPGIYAAGDIIGPPWLAHVATWEALQAVNGMFSDSTPRRVRDFPGCTYCQPQIASIGMNEETAKAKGIKYKIGKFPFSASGKAVASNHPDGFVKLIVDEAYGEILGAHIIGADATELIAEYALAMKLEATPQEIHTTIHAHPTLSESLMEAAAAIHGEAIHI
jgi:dihydrolipoamide dehydrogenase